jgi:predicted acylesterase/phospholipase RssA
MPRFNILSISGGGMRGVIAASIIHRLQNEIPFLDDVDLFSGTSTGSIIAAALASGKFSTAEILELYRTIGPEVFKVNTLDQIRSVFGLYKSKYSSDGLEKVMSRVFGDMKMKDLKRRVLIPTIDIGGKARPFRAKYFDNFKDSYDLDLKVSDVVVASCSGPTYFPAKRIKTPFGDRYFCDGGVVCNHSAVAAIAAAVDKSGIAAPISSVRCLLVTTGNFPQSAEGWRERGVVGWLDDIFDLLQEQYSTVIFQAEKILSGPQESGFHCINPMLPRQIKFDDAAAVYEMLRFSLDVTTEFAEQFIRRQMIKKSLFPVPEV